MGLPLQAAHVPRPHRAGGWPCTVLYCTVLYCTLQVYVTPVVQQEDGSFPPFYFPVINGDGVLLYCTALYCTVLYCTGDGYCVLPPPRRALRLLRLHGRLLHAAQRPRGEAHNTRHWMI